jgi:hypothetical protein
MMFPPCFLAVETRDQTSRNLRSFQAAEIAGGFLFDLHRAYVAFGLIVGEGASLDR